MTTKIFTDQMNRKISIPFPPKRIISLVPSQTEFLYNLGLNNEIIGQTTFCIHPEEKRNSNTIIGGTKNLKLDLIAQLKPDLIIGNKEENEQKQIEYLMQHFPVWMSDITTLNDSYEMMNEVAEMVDKKNQAAQMIHQIKMDFIQLKNSVSEHKNIPKKVAYFIWRKPYMVVSKNTFINHLIEILNFENVFAENTERYVTITEQDLIDKNPSIVLLSSEPYPFQQKHISEIQDLLPKAKIILVDGEMFSWYGSRLRFSANYFKNLLCQIAN
ncbi:MAG: ABC transporter substrate-binding protein [Bacteroidia bacterium]